MVGRVKAFFGASYFFTKRRSSNFEQKFVVYLSFSSSPISYFVPSISIFLSIPLFRMSLSISLSFSSSIFLSSVFLSVRSLSRHKTNTCNCYLENKMQTYRRRRDIFPLWSEILDGDGFWGRGPEVDLLNQNGRRFRLPYYLLC